MYTYLSNVLEQYLLQIFLSDILIKDPIKISLVCMIGLDNYTKIRIVNKIMYKILYCN